MPTRKPRKGESFQTLSRLFADENAAREWLEAKRWPDGPVCPHCGVVDRAYRLVAKPGSKRPVRPGVWKCRDCRKQFTVTIGTVFAETHIPLNKWLYAIHLMCSSKKGISANQLHRTLEITYKSAWFLCHRVRKAMEDLEPKTMGGMTGTSGTEPAIVEADETYIGGKLRGHGKGPHGTMGRGGNKSIVFALVQRDGAARSFHVPDATAKTLKGIMRIEVDGYTRIMTDEMHSYIGLNREFLDHQAVNHTKGEYVRGVVHTNFSESFFSLLKRGIIGAFHHVSSKHLQRYLTEFDFRWNSRDIEDAERLELAVRQTDGKRLFYRSPKWLPAQNA